MIDVALRSKSVTVLLFCPCMQLGRTNTSQYSTAHHNTPSIIKMNWHISNKSTNNWASFLKRQNWRHCWTGNHKMYLIKWPSREGNVRSRCWILYKTMQSSLPRMMQKDMDIMSCTCACAMLIILIFHLFVLNWMFSFHTCFHPIGT